MSGILFRSDWAIDAAGAADIKEGVKLSVANTDKQDESEDFEVGDVSVYEFGDDRFYKIEEDADEGEEQGVLYLQVVSDTLEAYLVGKTIAAFTDKTETTESHEERLADRIAKAEQEKVH